MATRADPDHTEADLIVYTAAALNGDRMYIHAASATTVEGLQTCMKVADAEQREVPNWKSNQNPNQNDSRNGSQPNPTPIQGTSDFSQMKCANCDTLGHSYRRCKKPFNKNKVDRAMAEILERNQRFQNRQVLWDYEFDPDIMLDLFVEDNRRKEDENSVQGEESESDEDMSEEEFEVERTHQNQIRAQTIVKNTGKNKIPIHRVTTDTSLSPYVTVKIEDLKVRALVDSGSQCTLVDESLCAQINRTKYRYEGPRLLTVSQEDITPEYVYPRLPITIGSQTFKVDTVVSRKMEPKLILGVDAMKAGNFTSNISAKKIIFTFESEDNKSTAVTTTPKSIEGRAQNKRTNRVSSDNTKPITIRTVIVHPNQTRLIRSTKDMVKNRSIRINRVSTEHRHYSGNRLNVKSKIKSEAENELINVDLPETYSTDLPQTATSQYNEEISKEPVVEETFLSEYERRQPDDESHTKHKIDNKLMTDVKYNKNRIEPPFGHMSTRTPRWKISLKPKNVVKIRKEVIKNITTNQLYKQNRAKDIRTSGSNPEDNLSERMGTNSNKRTVKVLEKPKYFDDQLYPISHRKGFNKLVPIRMNYLFRHHRRKVRIKSKRQIVD